MPRELWPPGRAGCRRPELVLGWAGPTPQTAAQHAMETPASHPALQGRVFLSLAPWSQCPWGSHCGPLIDVRVACAW